MSGYRTLRTCLLIWMICCAGIAAAESQYDALCREEAVEEVIAWLEIPETGFCEPVLLRESDGDSLYTQPDYNAADFSDPVTVVYGSSKEEGDSLRDLQELYSGRFEDCREILLHLPGKTLRYEVFAVAPYSSVHILHYWDFSEKRSYDDFFDEVYSIRRLGMHLDEDQRPGYGEKVLILSTGLRGDETQRYLVMAKCVAE